ncbi:MAG: MATE family efflux transporter [Ruminococcaceae bacterium]|nr:MATE family efflux transporter [Oscillospiraceae bacterium]
MSIVRAYIGDKAFYKRVLAVAVPIMVQNGITNFVSLLDNIMVGRIGTESMSGVAIVNQFIFIFNLLIFGAVSAAGIFTSQYHGLGDTEGVRSTFRIKLIITLIATLAAIGVFIAFDDGLISLFLHSGGTGGDLSFTLNEGKTYLAIMLVGLLPYALSQCYASTMRETGHTLLPMYASVVAVCVNFLLNLVLIFGLLGLPAMGVSGAALATVISRFAELLVLLLWGHRNKEKCRFLEGAYHSLRIPKELLLKIISKGLPLMANEFFWSLAVTMRNQCYSTRGLDAVAAQNINSTILNLFNVIYMAIGSSIAIIVGNELGAGKISEAKATSKKMMGFCIVCSVGLGILLSGTALLFPQIYNTTEGVRHLAAFMMVVSGVTMPFCAYAFSAYYTMRSGGKVIITLLFDSVYMWLVVIPITASLSYFTRMDIRILFAVCQSTEIIKAFFGYALMRKGSWAKQLVSRTERDVE